MNRLTPRQREVLLQAARGLTTRESALATHTAPETVKHHRRNILRELGARNMTHAVAIAHERGLLGGFEDGA